MTHKHRQLQALQSHSMTSQRTIQHSKIPNEQCPLHWAEVGLQGEQNTVSQSTGTWGRGSSNHSPFYKYRLWSSTPSRIFKLQHRDPGDQYFSWQPPEQLLRIFGEAVKAEKFCFFKNREMAGLNDQKGFQLPTKWYQVLMLFKQ